MNLILSTCLKSPFRLSFLCVFEKERKSLFKLTLSHLKEFHFFSECPCRSFHEFSFMFQVALSLGVESATCVILLCWQCHRYYDVGFSIMFALWSFSSFLTSIYTLLRSNLVCVLFTVYITWELLPQRRWDWKACVA